MESSSRYQSEYFSGDSTITVTYNSFSIFDKSLNSDIIPKLLVGDQYSFIGLTLMVLMLFIASIWHFLPEVLSNNFKSLTNNPLKRNWESTTNTSGLVVNTLLYINYLVVFSFLIFMILKNFTPSFFYMEINLGWLLPISIILTGLLIFRYLFITISGFIFKTFEMANHQNQLFNSLDRGLGLILLPILLFSLYGNQDLFLSISIFTICLFLVSRWVFTIVIGIRITKFSWFHIILYLCTLEIAPLLILLKTLENDVFKVL